MKKYSGLLMLFLVIAGIQLVPVERDNPPAQGSVPAPGPVLQVLQRSSYDCHSNTTVWPWYSRVAPVSWVMARHVKKGREHLNFTTWNAYGEQKRQELLREIWEEVAAAKMPLGSYLILHREARLSSADLVTLRDWAGR